MTNGKGHEIRVELMRQRLTQRWLMDALAQRGYTTLDEPMMSRILSGTYPWKLGRDVLAASEIILAERSKSNPTKIAQ